LRFQSFGKAYANFQLLLLCFLFPNQIANQLFRFNRNMSASASKEISNGTAMITLYSGIDGEGVGGFGVGVIMAGVPVGVGVAGFGVVVGVAEGVAVGVETYGVGVGGGATVAVGVGGTGVGVTNGVGVTLAPGIYSISSLGLLPPSLDLNTMQP
jgi:hypothetical protein